MQNIKRKIRRFTSTGQRKNSAGFTLFETIVTIVLFVLIAGAIGDLVVSLYRSHGYTFEQSTAIEEARRGVDTMIKEIREAREAEDGSYVIEKAGDKELIFYADIDNDGRVERVRYFLGTEISGTKSQECVSYSAGGTCSVNFSNFLVGTLKTAQVKVSVEGDFGASNEYADIFADSVKLGDVCKSGCTDCAGAWQGTAIFDVASYAADGNVDFLADASSKVDPSCSWLNPSHSMKARFELSWTGEITGQAHELKKGIVKPTGEPARYDLDQEQISLITSYVRNNPPIFQYFDVQGLEITDPALRLLNTRLIKILLVVNVDPNRPPDEFDLESSVQLRNLKSQ